MELSVNNGYRMYAKITHLKFFLNVRVLIELSVNYGYDLNAHNCYHGVLFLRLECITRQEVETTYNCAFIMFFNLYANVQLLLFF